MIGQRSDHMAVSRYTRVMRINDGRSLGTSSAHIAVRSAIVNGTISYTTRVLREAERLDTLAGSLYGDASYWWVLAAASGIGWGLQVPAGTVITVPDINQVLQIVG